MFWQYHAAIAKKLRFDYFFRESNLFFNKKIVYDYLKINLYLKKNCDYTTVFFTKGMLVPTND